MVVRRLDFGEVGEDEEEIPLLDGDDNPLRLTSMQGGVFDGEGRLYTLNGYCSGTTRGTGISVFAVV